MTRRRCRYCGHRIRDLRGRYTTGDTCVYHADLPRLEPLERGNILTRKARLREQA